MKSNILEIFNEGLTTGKLIWTEPWKGSGIFDKDTGLCNRLFHWELADFINKKNNNEFIIYLESEFWPECEFINLPNTIVYSKQNLSEYFKIETNNRYHQLSVDDIESLKKNKYFLDSSKEYISNFEYTFTDEIFSTNYELINRGIKSISIKNKNIENIISQFTKDMIGMHIRRGYGVSKNDKQLEYIKNLNLTVGTIDPLLDRKLYYEFYEDSKYFEIIDKILNVNPNQKFYISSDLGVESVIHFTEKYKNNIFTYVDILKNISNHLVSMSYIDYQFYYQHLVNIIDLFSLSFSKLLITSKNSSWSYFAQKYREIPSIDISKSNEEIINFINVNSITNV